MNPNWKWTRASYISASRIPLMIPIGILLFSEVEHNRLWVVGIIFIGVATDFLDGYLARRMHEVSDLGKVIDPLADKIAVGTMAVFLVILGDLPLWFFLAVIARDVLIVMGGMYIRRRKNIVTQSNMLGKVTVNVIALLLLTATVNMPALEDMKTVLLWSSVVFMVLSLAVYSKRLNAGRKGAG